MFDVLKLSHVQLFENPIYLIIRKLSNFCNEFDVVFYNGDERIDEVDFSFV